jgi:glycosyltransferase domain-containing protein
VDYSKDITIVVITFNRYSYLKRLLNFYEQYEIKFNFLILDSSSGKISEELDQYLQNQEHINHQRYGSDIFFADKIAEGCKHIKTPYVTLCADDDFLIPSGVIQAKEFLTQNSDYSSAHGLYFNHSSVEGSSKFGFHISPLYADGHSAEDNLPLERITAYLSGKTKYYPMYAVHQTELFQTIWSETKEYVSDWGLSELFPCALSLACGKMKVLPIFYASREPNVFSWCDENRLREMYSEAKIDKSINGITKQIKLIEKQPIEANHQYLKELFENYLRKKL